MVVVCFWNLEADTADTSTSMHPLLKRALLSVEKMMSPIYGRKAIESDKQTKRQTDRPTDRQTDREIDRGKKKK